MKTLESLIARDPGNRGVAALQVEGDLAGAVGVLAQARRVLIVTGFAVGPNGAAETDGPPGALFLTRALVRMGKEVAIATHRSCEPVMAAGIVALGLPVTLAVLAPGETPAPLLQGAEPKGEGPDAVVAVELPGRAADGEYYNMRGQQITARTSPLDGALLLAAARSIPTVGVGDGGNEAGMGKVAARVRTAVAGGDRIASVIPADFLVAAGTSNWGAYGIIAALDPALLHGAEEETALLTALVGAGALDGVRLAPEPTVDGIGPDVYLQTLEDLRTLSRGRAAV